MPDLPEQIRAFIDFGAAPVTINEVKERKRRLALFPLGSWTNKRLLGAVVMAGSIAALLILLLVGFNSSPVAHMPVTPVGHSKTHPNAKPHPKPPAKPKEPPTTIKPVGSSPTTGVRTSVPPVTSTTKPESTTTTDKPPPPTSTTISDIGPHDLQAAAGCTQHPNFSVNLTWSAGSTGDTETVEEQAGSGWSTVAVLPAGTTAYMVTPVPAYTYLTFRVQAGGYTSNLATTQTFPVC